VISETEGLIEIEEICPICDHENLTAWEVGKYGYRITCSNCGGRMMLCDICLHYEGNEDTECDWSAGNLCFRAREQYIKDTGKQWTETEMHMAAICYIYSYSLDWNKDGNIVITNNIFEGEDRYNPCHFIGKSFDDGLHKHYEYKDAQEMVDSWEETCKKTNEDDLRNNCRKTFYWLD
jgi:hypothetical protein